MRSAPSKVNAVLSGMPVDAFIRTQAQGSIAYLLEPIFLLFRMGVPRIAAKPPKLTAFWVSFARAGR